MLRIDARMRTGRSERRDDDRAGPTRSFHGPRLDARGSMLARGGQLAAVLPLAACGRREVPLPALAARDSGPSDVGFGATVTIAEGEVTCTAGHLLEIACGCGSLGFCTGDAEINVCTSGTSTDDCAAGIGVITADRHACGLCAGVTFTCPASGRFVIATWGSGSCYMEGHSQ
jgi:hypothetical protein